MGKNGCVCGATKYLKEMFMYAYCKLNLFLFFWHFVQTIKKFCILNLCVAVCACKFAVKRKSLTRIKWWRAK